MIFVFVLLIIMYPIVFVSKSPSSKSKSTSAIASVDLDLDSGDLSRVSGWAPRATSAQVPLVKSKSTSAAPRWTWP